MWRGDQSGWTMVDKGAVAADQASYYSSRVCGKGRKELARPSFSSLPVGSTADGVGTRCSPYLCVHACMHTASCMSDIFSFVFVDREKQ